jgi:hypothetical protein
MQLHEIAIHHYIITTAALYLAIPDRTGLLRLAVVNGRVAQPVLAMPTPAESLCPQGVRICIAGKMQAR